MSKISQSPYIPDSIEVEEIGENTIKIIAYPFENGHAITMAHPLKRLLMSSSAGYSAVGIKIDNIKHEFDSLNGMREDITQFLINIKNTYFKINDDSKDSIEIEYLFDKQGEIRSKDLSNEDVAVTNDIHLATLNEDGILKFKLIIKKGIGYISSEDIADEIGKEYIAIDAFFTPVKKVVYSVEKMPVGDNQDFEKIIFELKTTGQISPVKAFEEAVNVMYGQMKVFEKAFNIAPTKWVIETTKSDDANLEVLFDKIEKLNLSSRCFNALAKHNIVYAGDVVLLSESEVKNIPSLGKKSLDELYEVFESLGFPISEEVDESFKITLAQKLKELEGE